MLRALVPDVRSLRTAVVTTAFLALTLVACGGDDPVGGEAPSRSTAAGGAYPVTITHKRGTTTIPARPKRVVTLGLTDQDAVLALGVKPVAVTDWYGDYPAAVWPWAQDELGDAKPQVLAKGEFTGDQSYDYEEIIGLEPDLILSLYGAVSPKQYKTLSRIAPTVLPPASVNDYGIAWQDQLKIAGRALGESARADMLIADVDARFADARKKYPQFGGKSAIVAERFEKGVSFARSPSDPRTRFFTSLGFELPGQIAKLSGKKDGADISDENIRLLDHDLLVWNIGFSPAVRKELDANPLHSRLNVVRDRRVLFIDDDVESGALTWSTVLSLPYALSKLTPLIAQKVPD